MTQFSPCCIVPTYNNPMTIERVVERVRELGLPVILVDDGSGDAGRAACDRAAEQVGVVLHRREQNGGKGAAVKDGLRVARDAGYSHAVQVDADGQHNFEDIPLFLEAAQKQPTHLVLGYPVFDETVPKGRLIARQISVFWVNLETLGRRIIDPLCGFRVYPVAAALGVKVRGDRMDFDPEIAVRMVWAGIPVLNRPTKVRYLSAEEGGVSHFRYFHDNVRISWMHTRLVFMGIAQLLTWPVRRLFGGRA
jgi:polyprenyl-phospho-N-acetylgalactosaminyl synthase